MSSKSKLAKMAARESRGARASFLRIRKAPVNILRAPKIKCLGHVITKVMETRKSTARCSCGFFVVSAKANHQALVRAAIQLHLVNVMAVKDEDAKPTARERKLERLLRAAQRHINATAPVGSAADRLSQRISRAIVR